MTYLLWSLLNIALGVLFIYLCFKATKLINERTGLLASLVFVFGILAIMSSSRIQEAERETSKGHLTTWEYTPADSLDSNSTHIMRIDLEKNLISKYQF